MLYIGALIFTLTLISSVLWVTKYRNNLFAFLSLSLLILLLVFLANLGTYQLLFTPETSTQANYTNEDLSSFLALLFGTSVAFAGAWVAIVIASRIESLENTRFVQGHITPIYEMLGKLEYSFMKIGWKISPQVNGDGWEFPLSNGENISEDFDKTFIKYKNELINFYKELKALSDKSRHLSKTLADIESITHTNNIGLNESIEYIEGYLDEQQHSHLAKYSCESKEIQTIGGYIEALYREQAEFKKLELENLPSKILGDVTARHFEICDNKKLIEVDAVEKLEKKQVEKFVLMMTFDTQAIRNNVENFNRLSEYSISFKSAMDIIENNIKEKGAFIEYDEFEFSGKTFGDAAKKVLDYIIEKKTYEDSISNQEFILSVNELFVEFSSTLKEALNNKLATDFLLKKLGENWGLGKLYSWQILIEDYGQRDSRMSADKVNELFQVAYTHLGKDHEKFHALSSVLFSEISNDYDLTKLFELFKIESDNELMGELIDYALADKNKLQKVVT